VTTRRIIGIIALSATAGCFAVGMLKAIDGIPYPLDQNLLLSLIAVSVCAWLAFPAAIGLSKPLWRLPTIGFLVWLLNIALVFVNAAWLGVFPGLFQERIAIALAAGPVALGALALLRHPAWRVAAHVALVGAVLAVLVGWLSPSVLFTVNWNVGTQAVQLSLTFGGGLIIAACGRVQPTGMSVARRVGARVGSWMAVMAMLVTVSAVSENDGWLVYSPVMTLASAAWAISFLVCVPHAILAIPSDGTARALRTAALCFAVLGGFAWLAGVMAEQRVFASVVGLSATGGIGALLGLGAMAWLNRAHTRLAKASDLAAIAVTCPRCRSLVNVPPGASACPECQLRFQIQVEEPRCVGCGQWLNGLTADRCPECGRPLRDSECLMNKPAESPERG
jgi:hypothetical protein